MSQSAESVLLPFKTFEALDEKTDDIKRNRFAGLSFEARQNVLLGKTALVEPGDANINRENLSSPPQCAIPKSKQPSISKPLSHKSWLSY